MRLTYRCYPCILGDIAGALELAGAGEETASRVMAEVNALLHNEGAKRKPPSYYITEAHRALKREMGLAEPFAELRRRANEIGVELSRRIREDAEKLGDAERFRHIVMWCVAANHLDFRTAGTGYDFDPDGIYSFLENEYRRGLAVDMINSLLLAAQKARRVLYVHDNVGEVAIDTLLIAELRRMGARVSSALRGGPITSDATMEDGRAAGVFDAADEVILAGPDTLGISLDEMSEELAGALQTADLIVAKGQANYYVLTEYLNTHRSQVACLFSTKCDPVAEIFGLKGKKNIVWLANS